MHNTQTHTLFRQNKPAVQQNISNADKTVAVSPPDYGLDCMDKQRTGSRIDVAQLFTQQPVQRIGLQATSDETTPRPDPVKTENKTGLPDKLKAGLEQLSGYDMSGVRVHYNSSKPAQLDAMAYAQGNDIHLGSGQEKHLPHEAWHVVQQMQGRVKPTMQMKGTTINDDAYLEREADVMGERAVSASTNINYSSKGKFDFASSSSVVMRKPRGTDAKQISDIVRKTWEVEPGNRSDEVLATDGKSYAGFQLLWFLYHQDASGNWLDWANMKKRATLAYDLKAANCDQYADLSYCVARSGYNADSVVVEQQPGHAYAAMWDKEDDTNIGKQAVIDPWVNRGHLRQDENYYMSDYTQYNKIPCDGEGWYIREYTDKLKSKYVLGPFMDAKAKEGKEKAERKKKGENVPGMY